MKKLFTKVFLIAMLATPAMAQQVTVSGTVTDADSGEPLIGANIVEKGTTNGTVTDYDGNYQVNVSPGSILVISYIGYETQEFPLNNRTTINAKLTLNLEELDEVVVVGYGSVRKSDLTGSVSSVKSEDLVKVPNASPVQALQGKVSGMQVLSPSGDPGAAPVVRLRGVTTLNNNNPLFVVDGVIIEQGVSGASGGGTPLDFLNANDIESVEVLKDASATAIFGSRGSNGVIIVTTKTGSKGNTRINFNADYGWEVIANEIDVMNGREFGQYVNDIDLTEPGPYNIDQLPSVNWQDLIYKDYTPIQSYSFSFGGGAEKVNYYLGLGYYSQEGILPKSGLKRMTVKLNTDYEIVNNLTIGTNLSVALKDKKNAPGVVNTALRAWPIDEPYRTDPNTGERVFAEVNGGGNALAAIEYNNSFTKSLESVGNMYATYDFLDGFTFKSSFQFSLGVSKSTSFTPEFFVAPLQQNETSDISKGMSTNSFVLWENTLSYSKEFGVHRINAVGGYTTQEVKSEFLNGSAQNLLRNGETFWYLNSGDGDPLLQTIGNSGAHSSIRSWLFRVNYSLMDKYLFTATYRRDGSSKFGPNNRYGVFPSFAFGWNISDESFFPQMPFLDVMKLRASWGIVGNDKIQYDAQFAQIAQDYGAVFGSNEQYIPGASYSSGGNPNLKWEETSQVDVGLNLTMFNGRLNSDLDYYIKTTNDILVSLEPVGYSGLGAFSSIVYNVASVENRGFEWSLDWQDDIGDVNYRLGFRGSTVQNEVLKLGQDIGVDSLIVAGDLGNGQQVSRSAVGLPIGFFYGYDAIGIFQTSEQVSTTPSLFGQSVGDLIYRDVNDDGVIDANDRVNLGNSIPDFVYGFNMEVGYKGVRVSADFQGQTGVDIYNGKQAVRFGLLNYEEKYTNHWTPSNPTNEDFRAIAGGTNFQPSNYFIEDGSFLRLRTLTVSYSMPNRVLDGTGIQTARIYARGTNLFTVTHFSGYSPDLGASSALDGVIDRGVYPITKVYSVGLNLTF
ncbi:SusC/RagA family TonB-linked outer membrane protein [Marinoscillum sp.]|uniref:SusC/RagA family TonB-linked outer membrane protein n=1 Tax=Marinoscillum sp. TaxID=2024838 RepID=UPI003BABD96A